MGDPDHRASRMSSGLHRHCNREISGVLHRRCTRCAEWKPRASQFRPKKGSVHSWCRACERAYAIQHIRGKAMSGATLAQVWR